MVGAIGGIALLVTLKVNIDDAAVLAEACELLEQVFFGEAGGQVKDVEDVSLEDALDLGVFLGI